MSDRDRRAYDALRTDPALGPTVDRVGVVAVGPATDFFERFVLSVLRQQVSMAAAEAIEGRLQTRVELTPAGILSAEDNTLLDAGLSAAKVRYVNNIARAFEEREYSQAYFNDMSDEAVRAELTEITGVGPWTADMQLIFSLGRPDVFPVGDLGVREAMRTLFGDIDRAEMRDRAEAWAPFRSYASRYLWRLQED